MSGPGSPAVVCEVDATVDSCAASGLQPDTTYGYSIVAIYDLWQSSPVTTGATTMTPTFEITLSPAPYAAGVAVTVTQIETVEGTTVDTAYTGEKTITWSGLTDSPGGSAPSYPAAAMFTNGVANPSSRFTTFNAGSNKLIATDANSTAVTGSTTFSVATGVTIQIDLSPSLSTLESGSTQTFTAEIEDAQGNPITTGTDSTDSITFSQTSTPPGSVAIATPIAPLLPVLAIGGVGVLVTRRRHA